MRARLLLALALLLSACGDPYSPVCGSPPPAPRTGAISVPPANPPPRDMAARPDLASPDLAPAYPPAPTCGCPAEILGLTPHSVSAGYQGAVQVFGVGGWAASIKPGDVELTPGATVTGISRRSSNNLLAWIEVSPQAQGALDLRIRGAIVLSDALMVP